MTQRRRRFRNYLIVVLMTLLIVGVGAIVASRWIVGGLIARELKAVVASNLHAELRLGDVAYEFPMSATVDGAKLVARDAGGAEVTIMEIGHVDLTLARLPLGGGPVAISEVNIDAPAVQLLREADGHLTVARLHKQQAAGPTTSESGNAKPAHKLSDLFRLHQLTLTRGSIRFEDRSRPQTLPMLWEGIETSLETVAVANDPGVYHYTVDFHDRGVASVDAAGTFDVDDLVLSSSSAKFVIDLTNPGTTSHLPADVQALLGRLELSGKLRVDVRGTVPFRNVDACEWDADIKLNDASARLPVHVDFLPEQGVKEIKGLQIKSVMVDISVHGDPQNAWVTTQNISAVALGLKADVSGGRVTFPRPFEKWQAENIAAAVTAWPASPLPPRLAHVNPRGQVDFFFTGRGPTAAAGDAPWWQRFEHEFKATFKDAGAVMKYEGRPVDISGMNGSATLAGGVLQTQDLTGNVVGGSWRTSGKWNLAGPFDGSIDAREIDQRQLGQALGAPPDVADKLKGRGFVKATFSGNAASDVDTLGTLVATGRAEVLDGDLWQMPILTRVTERVKIARSALTAGQAAAKFDVASRKVTLRRAAVNAPVLGILGSGTIGFDGQLDLTVIATPFADWKRKVQGTRIPVLSEVAGAVVGVVQKGVNTVTRVALYQFKVTGTTGEPVIAAVPIPILTQSAQRLFEKMVGGSERLIEDIEKEEGKP